MTDQSVAVPRYRALDENELFRSGSSGNERPGAGTDWFRAIRLRNFGVTKAIGIVLV